MSAEVHILDQFGRSLKRDDWVRRRPVIAPFDQPHFDKVRGFVWRENAGWHVQLRSMVPLPTLPHAEKNTYWCPDLELVNPPDAVKNDPHPSEEM